MSNNNKSNRSKSVSASAKIVFTASASFSITQRILFATSHMLAAAQLARLAGEIEISYDDSRYSRELFLTHQGYVTSSVVMAAASVEANINEFLDNLRDSHTNNQYQLSEQILEQQKFHWGILQEKRIGTLEKYQLSLWWAGVKMEKGESPYQDMKQLIKFRDGMMHFRPDTVSIEPPPEDPFDFQPKYLAKVAKFLWVERNLKDHSNPILSPERETHSIFPSRLLSYNCAKWAVESGVNFINHFCNELGLKSSLAFYEDRLKL